MQTCMSLRSQSSYLLNSLPHPYIVIRRALCRRRYLGIITIVRKKAEEEAARKKKEDQARDEAGRTSEAPKVKSAPSSAASPQKITRPEVTPSSLLLYHFPFSSHSSMKDGITNV